MIRFGDSWAYCNFAHATDKYNAAFFGGGSGTLTGGIVGGPLPGTFGLRLQQAIGAASFFGNTGWFLDIPFASGFKDWIVSMWIKPANLTGRRTFLSLGLDVLPNLAANVVLQINASKLELWSQQTNLRMNSGSTGTQLLESIQAFPSGAYTHFSLKLHIDGQLVGGQPIGTAELRVNGALDQSLVNLPLSNPATPGANHFTLCWQESGAGEISISQPTVCDLSGGVNNTHIKPGSYWKAVFPAGDDPVQGWNRVPGPSAVGMVTEIPADEDASYISPSSLVQPDELFTMPAGSTAAGLLGLILNARARGASAQSYQAIVRKAADAVRLLGSAAAVPASYKTQQFIADRDPQTALAWVDSDVAAAAFGLRGLSGTGERVTQLFLEKLVEAAGIGSYAY